MTTANLDVLDQRSGKPNWRRIQTILDTADKLRTGFVRGSRGRDRRRAPRKSARYDRKIGQARHDSSVMAEARKRSATRSVCRRSAVGSRPGRARAYRRSPGSIAKKMAATLVTAMPKDQTGQKSLASGQTTTSTIVVPPGRRAGPARRQQFSTCCRPIVDPPNYAFMRQSVRTLAAAPGGGRAAAQAVAPTEPWRPSTNRLRVVAQCQRTNTRHDPV